jgi:mannose/fructose/N-acetylgalactosamine-specific phosphotransferase system component IIC
MRCYVSSESKTRSGLKVVGIYLILLGFSYLINFMVEREATLLFVLEFSDSNPAFD